MIPANPTISVFCLAIDKSRERERDSIADYRILSAWWNAWWKFPGRGKRGEASGVGSRDRKLEKNSLGDFRAFYFSALSPFLSLSLSLSHSRGDIGCGILD